MKKYLLLCCLAIVCLSCQKEQITSLKLNQTTCNITIEEECKLIVTPIPFVEDPFTIEWKSSDPSIAEIRNTTNTTCQICGKSAGTATITCKTVSNETTITATCKVTVTSNATFLTEVITIEKGKKINLREYISNYSGYIEWLSSSESICTISNDYLIAHETGSCYIYAKLWEHNVELTCKIEVINVKPTDIVTTNRIEIFVGDTYTVSYKLIPEDAVASVSLTCDNNEFVDIMDGMTIRAKQIGSTYLTLTTDNISRKIYVNVIDITSENITNYVIASFLTPGSVNINGYVTGAVSTALSNNGNKEIFILDCTIYSDNGNTRFAYGEFNKILPAGEQITVTPISCSNLYMPSCVWKYQFEGNTYIVSAAYDPYGGIFGF